MKTITHKNCKYCNKQIPEQKRNDTLFCSPSHRQLAYLQRMGVVGKKHCDKQVSQMIQKLLKLVQKESASKFEISELKFEINSMTSKIKFYQCHEFVLEKIVSLCDQFLNGMSRKNIDIIPLLQFRPYILVFIDEISAISDKKVGVS